MLCIIMILGVNAMTEALNNQGVVRDVGRPPPNPANNLTANPLYYGSGSGESATP